MRAHKVPATYYAGWKMSGHDNSFYVYYKNALNESGISKRFRSVRNITQEHSYFMEEDFYEINVDIKGMEYKLEAEITEYFDNVNEYEIYAEGEKVDDYRKYMYYLDGKDEWEIKDVDGNAVTYDTFFASLNTYIESKVGDIVEKTYFAEYLEPLWVEIKDAFHTDINGMSCGSKISMSKRTEFLEFFVMQYMRTEHYVDRDVKPILQTIVGVFEDMLEDEEHKEDILSNGMFGSDVYFYGFLLDVARGNSGKLHRYMDRVDKGYAIDILQAPTGMTYITSTNPCVIAKLEDGVKKEIYFPIDFNLCAYFRKRQSINDTGNYVLQTVEEVKTVNNVVVRECDDIVISNEVALNGLL